jgi:Nucleotidyl transferase AbiEii toxin, Type IV TA system
MPESPLHAVAAVTERELLLRRGSRYAGGMPALPDKLSAVEDSVTAFTEHGVPYALIGGLAVGIRSGVPRATLDVDFAVPTHVDRPALIAFLATRAFKLKGEFAHSINFVHASGEPVQLAFDVGFDPMIERAEGLQLGNLLVRVVTTPDLIAMKRRAAADPRRRRSKALRDQADIALLEGDVPDPDEGW